MKQIEIAKKHNVSAMFISNLLSGDRYTTNPDLAKSVSARVGKPPIDFISPKLREVYLKAWPELGETINNQKEE
jgi:hypothetical protein